MAGVLHGDAIPDGRRLGAVRHRTSQRPPSPLDALRNADVSPDDIRHVVLSHLHFDHCLNLPSFQESASLPIPGRAGICQEVLSGDAVDPSIPDFWPSMLENHRVHAVDDGFRLSPTKRLRVFPGHTPGSMAMICDGPYRMAVCGDAVKNAWEAVTGRAGMPLAGEAAASASIAASSGRRPYSFRATMSPSS